MLRTLLLWITLLVTAQLFANWELPEVVYSDSLYQAALGGNPEAQYLMGAVYVKCPEEDMDLISSLYWFKKAEMGGYSLAQTLCDSLCTVMFTEQEFNDILEEMQVQPELVRELQGYSDELLKEAVSGDAEAQGKLGLSYISGMNIKMDVVEGLHWLLSSADGGWAWAQSIIAAIYHDTGRMDKYLSYVRQAAEQGLAVVQSSLGDIYRLGELLPQDMQKAAAYYKLAAEQDDISAQVNLAYAYYNGEGVDEEREEAYRWWKVAADRGDDLGQVNVGMCLETGDGVQKNLAEAIRYYTLSAEQGNSVACLDLGYLYYHGVGTSKNHKKALEWFLKAAEKGELDAQFNAGAMYYHGEGTPENRDEALFWWWIGAVREDEKCRDALASTGEERTQEQVDRVEPRVNDWFELHEDQIPPETSDNAEEMGG